MLGTPALHSGIDFRATGRIAKARVTAPGTVTNAGWNGGYGRMVEVDHGNGFSTRYGHLSRIDVRSATMSCSAALSASRQQRPSTGPHLHYEVRRNGDAIDPLAFLKAGKKLGTLL